MLQCNCVGNVGTIRWGTTTKLVRGILGLRDGFRAHGLGFRGLGVRGLGFRV